MRGAFAAIIVVAALAAAACTQIDGPTIRRPAVWEPPELTPGAGFFAFDLSSVTQHTFATRAAYAHPTVSPDGKRIAYSSTINGDQPDIFVQDIGGRAAREIAPNPQSDITPAFSPDGKQIAFASNRDGRWNIYVTGLEDNGPVFQLTDDDAENFAPSFSPDGRTLAFSTRRAPAQPWMIALCDLASGTRTLLCEGVYPDFSPLGDLIVFSRNSRREPGWPSLWTIRPNGRDLTEIYRSDEYGAITPSFAGPDWILFSTIGRLDGNEREGFFRADDIWMVGVNGVNAARVTWHGMQDWDPVYEPAAGRCYYISLRDGAQNVFSAAITVPKSLPGALGGGK